MDSLSPPALCSCAHSPLYFPSSPFTAIPLLSLFPFLLPSLLLAPATLIVEPQWEVAKHCPNTGDIWYWAGEMQPTKCRWFFIPDGF